MGVPFSIARILARRETGYSRFVCYQLMAGFAIKGPLSINGVQLAPQWVEQCRHYFRVMDILQRHVLWLAGSTARCNLHHTSRF